MRSLFLILPCLFLTFSNLTAQLNPIHQMDLNGICEKVYIHNRTGIPIFKTSTSYEAINPETYQTIWKLSRQGGATITEATSEDNFSDYFELPASNIVYVGNSFVDVLTGKVLADGKKEEINRLNSFHLFPAKDLMVVKVAAKGTYRLYGVDPVKAEVRWKTDIDPISGLSLSGLTDNDPVTSSIRGLKPYIASTGDIVYVHQKDMMLIDPKTGNLKWKQPLEPGIVLFSKAGNLIAVAERRTGLGSAMDMSGGSKYGKKLVVVEAATGENAWKKEIKLDGNILFMQPYKDGFIVAHEEGFNIYDFNSPKGEPAWKKDFAAKDISDVVEDGSNIMVYYKDRRMLMNPVSGEDVWKKPEKLEQEVAVFSGGNKIRVNDVDVTFSGSRVTLNHTKAKKYDSFAAEVYAYDKTKNTLLATFDNRADPATITVGKKVMGVNFVDLSTLKRDYQSVPLKQWVLGVEPVAGGYFIHSRNQFYLINSVAGKVNVVKTKDYPNPGEFGRDLLGAATAVGFSAVYVAGAMGAGEAMVVGNQEDYDKYAQRMSVTENAGNAAFSMQKRSTNARLDKDYVFFFSKNDAGNLVLFQVRKADGEEVEQYLFDDKTPIYELDYGNGNLYYLNGKALKVFKLKQG
jgi:hypothetical protein